MKVTNRLNLGEVINRFDSDEFSILNKRGQFNLFPIRHSRAI